MKNDVDLQRLVSLLSYLKKHDDVESDLEKKIPLSLRPSTPWEAAQTGRKFTTDPAGSVTTKKPGHSTAPGGSAPAYQTSDSSDPGIGPSSVPPSITQEIRNPSIPIKPYKDYHPHGTEIGPREGKFDTVGDTPIESVTAPEPVISDTSDASTDEEREIVQWFKDEGWTLSELKQMIEDFTAPAGEASKKIKGPQDYQRHSDFQRSALFTKSKSKIVRKFNESNILDLFNRLGI